MSVSFVWRSEARQGQDKETRGTRKMPSRLERRGRWLKLLAKRESKEAEKGRGMQVFGGTQAQK
ncbi:unnamed protein product [Fusarium venenatum]|uniref:Uncharacterized protein n=1 Tax=Fusarium venenatum TaxID=56646 RepID=A0A2L2T5U0_9HYPO|nr:uncharacterized protein FVRRES_01730 [Fusarium venenatum]CEI65218.1 unnamed protein product [Fusarium venenatum]